MPAPSSVDDYLSNVPDDARAALERLREVIKGAAPDATETISYRMPTFKHRGKPIVGIAAFKNHCSLFPYSKGVMATLEDELKPYDIAGDGATIRFTVDEPLPDSLVEKVVRTRIEEIEGAAR